MYYSTGVNCSDYRQVYRHTSGLDLVTGQGQNLNERTSDASGYRASFQGGENILKLTVEMIHCQDNKDE